MKGNRLIFYALLTKDIVSAKLWLVTSPVVTVIKIMKEY